MPSLPCLVVAKAGLAHTLHWKELVETNFALLCSFMVSAAWLIYQAASGIRHRLSVLLEVCCQCLHCGQMQSQGCVC